MVIINRIHRKVSIIPESLFGNITGSKVRNIKFRNKMSWMTGVQKVLLSECPVCLIDNDGLLTQQIKV